MIHCQFKCLLLFHVLRLSAALVLRLLLSLKFYCSSLNSNWRVLLLNSPLGGYDINLSLSNECKDNIDRRQSAIATQIKIIFPGFKTKFRNECEGSFYWLFGSEDKKRGAREDAIEIIWSAIYWIGKAAHATVSERHDRGPSLLGSFSISRGSRHRQCRASRKRWRPPR